MTTNDRISMAAAVIGLVWAVFIIAVLTRLTVIAYMDQHRDGRPEAKTEIFRTNGKLSTVEIEGHEYLYLGEEASRKQELTLIHSTSCKYCRNTNEKENNNDTPTASAISNQNRQ